MDKELQLKNEIIEIGKKLYDARLVTARSGNLSARIECNEILITASGTCLGSLKESDIVKVDLSGPVKNPNLTSEFPLHSLIYKSFPEVKKIIHCHPSLTNAYYSIYDNLKYITFESRLFLGEVPVVIQETPNITQPEKAIDALHRNNIIAIKNHGVVAVGQNFEEAFYLIEELEETVKIAGLAKLLNKNPDTFETKLKKSIKDTQKSYPMFSKEHIAKIVDLINQDENFLAKAKELSLNTKIAIQKEGIDTAAFIFNFQNGRIGSLEEGNKATFVISGPENIWRLIFEGKLDPFAATTQGKLKLHGDFKELSKWYVPFSRMFALFKEVEINS